jgi:transposase
MFNSLDVEERIRPGHAFCAIREVVDWILAGLSPLLASAYSDVGRLGIPPEMLLKALLLQCLYSLRTERQLGERIDSDPRFHWFCGMDPSERVFDASAFAQNRSRLDRCGATAPFFAAVRDRAIGAGLASDEHFSVEGTLIESHPSIKSFRPKGGDDGGDSGGFNTHNPEVDFKGERPPSRRTAPAPTPRSGCTASRAATRRCSATWAM